MRRGRRERFGFFFLAVNDVDERRTFVAAAVAPDAALHTAIMAEMRMVVQR